MDLRLKNIRKRFDGHMAVDGISLDVASGELVALLGPSGSGKTTLLRLIAGLEFPTDGAIYFGDEDASRKSVGERNVGMVFQHYALFKHMSVLDNVCFGLRVRRRSERPAASDIRKHARNLLDLVQLSGLEGRFPAQLSGGQRQRVALARALAIEPRLLLLDEPFGALDAKVRRELRRWLREIHDRTGHTTLFVTHDQEEALELADRIVVMNAGRIEQVGTADEIYDRPATSYVFGFIGESSAVPVEIRSGRVLFDGVDIGLGDGIAERAASSQTIGQTVAQSAVQTGTRTTAFTAPFGGGLSPAFTSPPAFASSSASAAASSASGSTGGSSGNSLAGSSSAGLSSGNAVVRLREGRVSLPDGPAQLYMRPHDVAIGGEGQGGLHGKIVAMRRHGAVRRAELLVGKGGHRVEFDLPADAIAIDGTPLAIGSTLSVRPRHWTVYPAN